MRFFVPLAVLALSWAGAQQQQLVLNGRPVAGLSTELVPGTAYAPAEGYARALGADYRFDPQAGVLLSFGGHLLTLRSFGTAAQAMATDALMVDGRTLPGTGAVRAGGTVYLPVKSVTAALGGRTAYLSEYRTVAAVFPRPQLMAAQPPRVWGSSERFVLSFNAPVGLEPFFDASLNLLRLRFPRAELGSDALAERRLPAGSRYSDAAFVPGSGFLDFNVILQEGNAYSVFSEAVGEGQRVIIDIFREAGQADAQSPVLVLKAGAGTATLAEQVQGALEARGVQVRSAAGDEGHGAPFMLALRRAPLAAGRFNIYYLTGDAPLLDAPVRFAAADAASEAGRARVAQLTPDLARGERSARALADALERRTPLTLGALLGAPLLDLSGAAGRGVMLELSAADLEGGALVEPVADALDTLVRSP